MNRKDWFKNFGDSEMSQAFLETWNRLTDYPENNAGEKTRLAA